MKRLLAARLVETRPAQDHHGKTFRGLLLSNAALHTAGDVEEDSDGSLATRQDSEGSTVPTLSPFMCSSPRESGRPSARVLMKDGLAYVVVR